MSEENNARFIAIAFGYCHKNLHRQSIPKSPKKFDSKAKSRLASKKYTAYEIATQRELCLPDLRKPLFEQASTAHIGLPEDNLGWEAANSFIIVLSSCKQFTEHIRRPIESSDETLMLFLRLMN